jgi:hypothetical protein
VHIHQPESLVRRVEREGIAAETPGITGTRGHLLSLDDVRHHIFAFIASSSPGLLSSGSLFCLSI